MNRRLIYVVGPSGAGKDSVLSWLRQRTPESASVHWARRTIDRPNSGEPGAENHEQVDAAAFEQLVADTAFAMHWDANTHLYGIRHSELVCLNDSSWCVMVNGSRAHLPMAARDYPGLTVLHITAAASVLRERLTRRGRESAEAIEARLSRIVDLSVPNGSMRIEICNDSTLEYAGEQLLKQLQAHALWPRSLA
jgi:ribose 1,5-bisphosphokinase